MKNDHTPTTAEKAVAHILRRCQQDENFLHYMAHTQSLALCLASFAEARGEDPDKLAEKLYETGQRIGRKPEVVELRQQVEDLKRRLQGKPSAGDEENESRRLRNYRAAINNVTELLRLAEICGNDVSAEELREALSGDPLAYYNTSTQRAVAVI